MTRLLTAVFVAASAAAFACEAPDANGTELRTTSAASRRRDDDKKSKKKKPSKPVEVEVDAGQAKENPEADTDAGSAASEEPTETEETTDDDDGLNP